MGWFQESLHNLSHVLNIKYMDEYDEILKMINGSSSWMLGMTAICYYTKSKSSYVDCKNKDQ